VTNLEEKIAAVDARCQELQAALDKKQAEVVEPQATLDDKRVEVVRSTLRHENDLTNHRITWLVVFNGLALNAINADAKSLFGLYTAPLVVSALLVTLSAGFALAIAGAACKRQVEWFKRHQPKTPIDAPGEGIVGIRSVPAVFIMPRHVIPSCLFGVWCYILTLRLAPPPAAPQAALAALTAHRCAFAIGCVAALLLYGSLLLFEHFVGKPPHAPPTNASDPTA
jgi:hypothetical protein